MLFTIDPSLTELPSNSSTRRVDKRNEDGKKRNAARDDAKALALIVNVCFSLHISISAALYVEYCGTWDGTSDVSHGMSGSALQLWTKRRLIWSKWIDP